MKLITENIMKTDLKKLRKGGFKYGTTMSGILYGSIRFKISTDQITFSYSSVCNSVFQTVQLDWHNCKYGSKRPYFICPSCGKRILTLYCVHTDFQCHKCSNLYYRSQADNAFKRIIARYEKEREKLN